MKVWHLIPAEEDGLHEINTGCVCEPSPVPEDLKDEAPDWLRGEVAFEHHPFSPLPLKRDPPHSEWESYVGYQEK